MRTTLLLAAIAMLASAPVLAGEREDRHERQQRTEQTAPNGFDHGMQPVAHNAGPGERAHGWRYFSDPATYRAVVITPSSISAPPLLFIHVHKRHPGDATPSPLCARQLHDV